MFGVNGAFKLTYYSPCVTVPILSCGYGRGRAAVNYEPLAG